MKKKLTLFTTLFCLCFFVFAQSDINSKRQAFPYHLTAEEQLLMHTLPAKAQQQATEAPQGPVTSVAEFLPMEGVIVSDDQSGYALHGERLGLPVSFIKSLSQITQVKMMVENSSQQNTYSSSFSQQGVNMSNVEFWEIPHDTYWTRDYGPWFIIDGNDKINIVDFTYNRPGRANDDAAMDYFASKLNCTLYAMPLVHTGGNYMSDGYGTAASTQLVLDENPDETATTVQQIAQEYLGINNYFIIDDPMDDYIDHIDCWAKFLGVDKVLVAQLPTSDYRYADYEAAAAVFANATSPWGNHYQVYRVFEPGSGWIATPYTNSLILNDHVFVPIAGSQYDEDAIEVYRQAMPGYTIVPVMQDFSARWENTDALHCRTHEIADRGMLYIKHYPLLGEQQVTDGSAVLTADIKALSGQSLITDSLLIFYRINHAVWQNTPLASVGGSSFEATLAGLQNLDTVEYYIFAKDQSGRREHHPYIGAADPHRFVVNAPDAITETQPEPSIMIYPNPAVDRFWVRGENLSWLKVYNAMGQSVAEYQLDKQTNDFNCKDWPAGVYCLSVFTDNGVKISRKLVKL